MFESEVVGLRAGDDLLISALDSADEVLESAGNSPINLLVSFPNAASSLLLRDINDLASLDVLHAASGVSDAEVYFAPQADFVACSAEDANGDDPSASCTQPLVQSIAFSDQVRTVVDPGSYALRVNAEGAGSAEAPISADSLQLNAGFGYIAVAAGHAVDVDVDLFPLFLERQSRAIATQATVRLVHAASLAGPVSVFVTEAGEVTDADVQFAEVTPTLTLNVRANSGYLALPGGDYDIRIAVPLTDGGYDVVFSQTDTFADGSVLDLIVRNPDENEGEFEVGVMTVSASAALSP
ncbi:MAG: hypothetical protein C0462_06845 [Alcanivorax sp.]|nr:hypothetical protein [Alcanivorax sp.]